MSLVGDIIMQVRRRIPDAPNVIGPPNFYSATPITVPYQTLFTPGSGPMFLQMSVTNQWGESQVVNIPGVVLTGTQNAVQVSAAAQLGCHTINFYQGWNSTSASWQRQSIPWPGTLGGTTWIVDGVGNKQSPTPPGWPVVPQSSNPYGFVYGFWPPTRDTAFLPDTDGNFIGAFTAYQMLNEALGEMVKIAGGIIDVTGVQSQINQSMYRLNSPIATSDSVFVQPQLNSPFYQFTNAWYDGYPMDVVQRSMMYLRNSAAGFSGILSYEQDGPQQTIQVWPQSNRTGGATLLTVAMGITDTGFIGLDARSFLSIGLAQIGTEIVGYSQINGNSFNGVIRGLGGTEPVTHAVDEQITELNIRMSGYRMAKTYSVGDAAKNLMVPQAWERPLVLHMLSQVRSMEQDDAQAGQLMQLFTAEAEKIAKGSRLGRLKPRQIPIWGQTGTDARNVNGIGFGWLVN